MKNVLLVIGFIAFLASLSNVIVLSLEDYHQNILNIGGFVFLAVMGYVLMLFAGCIVPKISEQELEDIMKAHQRNHLREQMKEWSRELKEEEIEKLSRGTY
jgi:hypothetical protein